MERIPSAQPPPLSKHQASDVSDMQGMDFPMYVYKPRRGMKRGEESKETYKLPHRLIEKKRRDRINECIAQLKDLLPEHLKLTTLGHLEKAVVLELTLKHVKALTSLLEQQQQKILALQSGMKIEQASVSQEKSEELFQSGFHMCAKEVLQYLANQEASRDLTPSHLISHLHALAAQVLQGHTLSPRPEEAPTRHKDTPTGLAMAAVKPDGGEGYGRNCVPVIQRAYAPAGGELSGSDTDTDSGYGGELEKAEAGPPTQAPGSDAGSAYYKESQLKRSREGAERRASGGVKQEEPRHKRPRAADSSSSEEESSGESSSSSSGHGSYMSVSPRQPPAPHPLCMPFYLLPPAAAAYLPLLEKCWYPMLYPGLGSPAHSERLSPPQLMLSPRGGSPAPPMDSPTLLQALKQLPPLSLEAKD